MSDTEIKIKAGNQRSKTYDKKELGFKKEGSQAWKEFIKILNSKDHYYHVGKARGAKRERKTSYDVGRKVLVEINNKLVPFFNKTYQLQLPEKYKVYELIPEKKEAPGTYRFKFQIKSDSDDDIVLFNSLPRDQLVQKIEVFSEKYKKLSGRGTEEAEIQVEQVKGKLYIALKIALEKEWLTKKQGEYYLNQKPDDLSPIQYPNKIGGVWKNNINDSSPGENLIDQEDSAIEE